MQVTRPTFIPLLAPANSDRMERTVVCDEYHGDLSVVYTFGPQFGRRVVTQADLEQLELTPRALRRAALDHLEVLSSRAEFHGQPPALMLSFDGLESSLLLATDFWSRLAGAVPGELVVGVPARDVVIVTGTQSQAGLEKARRCVERIFFAGGEHMLSRSLLVRQGTAWEPFDRAPRPAGRPGFGPAHQHGVGQPPRQYQEHPSWPRDRVAPMRPPVPRRPPAARPMHAPTAQGPAPLGPPGSPLTTTSTGGMRPVSASPHQRQQPEPADVAQYSAVPYSAMPSSAVPYSAMPYSAMPYSAIPYSAVPNSGSPYSLAQPGPQPPANRDDETYSTSGSRPRPLYPEYAPVSATPSSGWGTGNYPDAGYQRDGRDRAEAPPPQYPGSWGSAPGASSRAQFRSGPRARFSR